MTNTGFLWWTSRSIKPSQASWATNNKTGFKKVLTRRHWGKRLGRSRRKINTHDDDDTSPHRIFWFQGTFFFRFYEPFQFSYFSKTFERFMWTRTLKHLLSHFKLILKVNICRFQMIIILHNEILQKYEFYNSHFIIPLFFF